jgi:hypothetical protein
MQLQKHYIISRDVAERYLWDSYVTKRGRGSCAHLMRFYVQSVEPRHKTNILLSRSLLGHFIRA